MDLGLRLGIGLPWSPWRVPHENFKWKKETAEKLQKDIDDIKPTQESGLNKFKVLTIGLMGQGKSSLINSFASISVDEKSNVCNAASMTTTVTTHFRDIVFPGKLEQLVLGDISGFPLKSDIKDIHPSVESIKLVLQGHIKSGYKFNPEKSISTEDESYISSPRFSDMIHCAMIVIDSTMAYELPESYLCGLKTIMEAINSKNIPVIAVLTKADLLSEHVKFNIDSIFRCRKIEQAVQKICKQLEISASKIYPVVNFEEMDHFTWKETIPILIVLKSLLRMAQLHSRNADEVVHTQKNVSRYC